tara:strand:+ start:1137 stop:1274 length:138 start_codon:yes stop_codon:yes gene_type:complete
MTSLNCRIGKITPCPKKEIELKNSEQTNRLQVINSNENKKVEILN